ncbi:MAG: sugar ABC transporter ATP-binding protein [Chloroflexi bacterium]|nr:sugar ABC transporter ATP-binding protein [Chloroflexota bacterium]
MLETEAARRDERRAASPPPSATLGGGGRLRAEGITKWYGSVQALDGVSMSAEPGEVVALVGDNGAGKSTLINIIAGAIAADAGTIFVNDQPVTIASTEQAEGLGICCVHQEKTLADNLDVVENLFLGRELTRGLGPFRRVDFASMRIVSQSVLVQLGISTIADIQTAVGHLSGGQRQSVVVGRTLLREYPIVLLDEPTAGLGVAECRRVMDLVKRLRERGAATVIVSQNIDEVFEVADRIVVLHLGKVAGVFRKSETTPEAVVGAVMGLDAARTASAVPHPDPAEGQPEPPEPGHPASTAARRVIAPAEVRPEALRVENVSKAYGSVQALAHVSLTVNHGEIVALVGDNGAGKSTLVKIISGVVDPDEGEFHVEGERVVIQSPNDAADRGIRTIHQDLALADNLDVPENLFLGRELSRGGGLLRRVDFVSMKERTIEVLAELGIGTISDVGVPVAQLSGGQRQTVAVARATLTNCSTLLLDEPTASMGLNEARHVIELVHRLREQGTAVLIITHNMRQVFEVADRIVVLHLGRVAAVFRKSETTPEIVIKAIMGTAT